MDLSRRSMGDEKHDEEVAIAESVNAQAGSGEVRLSPDMKT